MLTAEDGARFAAAQGAPDHGIYRLPGDGPGTFRVNASISEMRGDFRMRVDDKPTSDGKASRTRVEVLQTGTYGGQPVTKLLFRWVVGTGSMRKGEYRWQAAVSGKNGKINKRKC